MFTTRKILYRIWVLAIALSVYGWLAWLHPAGMRFWPIHKTSPFPFIGLDGGKRDDSKDIVKLAVPTKETPIWRPCEPIGEPRLMSQGQKIVLYHPCADTEKMWAGEAESFARDLVAKRTLNLR